MSDEYAAAAPEVDQPNDAAPDPGAPDQSQQPQESFTDFNPDELDSQGLSPDWLKERYGQMQKDYTQKTMELGDARKNADLYRGLQEGITSGNPTTARYQLEQLGLTENDILQIFELERAEAEQEAQQQEPEFDELDFKDPRVDKLLEEREAERAERQQQAQQAEADQYADQVGGRMEEELKAAFDGKEPSDFVANAIFSYALDNPGKDGEPDMKAAIAAYRQEVDGNRQEWLDSRTGPRATTQGIPGSERYDTSTKAGRDALGALGAQEAASSR